MTTLKSITILLLCSSLAVLSCKDKARQSDILAEINALDSIQRRAHYEKDAELLGSIMADSFYVASRGRVSWSSRQNTIERFREYFKQVTYSSWENVKAPLVEISGNDMALITYEKRTISTESDPAKPDTVHFAWASLLRKTGGKWKIHAIITTDDQ